MQLCGRHLECMNGHIKHNEMRPFLKHHSAGLVHPSNVLSHIYELSSLPGRLQPYGPILFPSLLFTFIIRRSVQLSREFLFNLAHWYQPLGFIIRFGWNGYVKISKSWMRRKWFFGVFYIHRFGRGLFRQVDSEILSQVCNEIWRIKVRTRKQKRIWSSLPENCHYHCLVTLAIHLMTGVVTTDNM
jgi:hypothetical protein